MLNNRTKRATETDTETQFQSSDRQTTKTKHRQSVEGRFTDRETGIHRDRETEIQRVGETEIHRNGETEIHRDGETEIHRYRGAEGQIDAETSERKKSRSTQISYFEGEKNGLLLARESGLFISFPINAHVCIIIIF